MDASMLESALSKCLSNAGGDKAAEAELIKQLSTKPTQLAAIELLCSPGSEEVRNFLAVLLRRVCLNATLEDVVLEKLKNVLLEQLKKEERVTLARQLCELTAAVASAILANQAEFNEEMTSAVTGDWPEFGKTLAVFLSSPVDSQNFDKGVRLLAATVAVAPEIFADGVVPLCQLLRRTIATWTAAPDAKPQLSTENVEKLLSSAGGLVAIAANESLAAFKQLAAASIAAIQRLVTISPTNANACLDIFEAFADCELQLLPPPLPQEICDFLLGLAAREDLTQDMRANALGVLSDVVASKRKVFAKPQLFEPLIHAVWNLLDAQCRIASPEAVREFCMWLLGKAVPEEMLTVVTQTMHSLASSLPSGRLVTTIFELSRKNAVAGGPTATSLIAFGAVVENCEEFIKTNCLQAGVEAMLAGLNAGGLVSIAALFGLTEAGQYLEPELAQRHGEKIVTALCTALDSLPVAATGNPVHESDELRAALLLGCVAELIEGDLPVELVLQPSGRLDSILRKAGQVAAHGAFGVPTSSASDSPSAMVRMCALDALHALCQRLGKHLDADRARALADLMCAIIEPPAGVQMPDELRLDAIRTLTTLVSVSGQAPWQQGLLEASLRVCASLLQKGADLAADCKAKVFRLIGELARFVPEKLVGDIPILLEHFSNSATELANQMDAAGASGSGDDSEDLDLNSDIVDEAAAALSAIGQVALAVGPLFLPYWTTSFERVWALSSFPSMVVRDGVHACTIDLMELASRHTAELVNHINNVEKSSEGGAAILAKRINDMVEKWLEEAYGLVEDEAAIQSMDALTELLKRAKPLLQPYVQFAPLLLGLVSDALTPNSGHRLRCQRKGDGEDAEEEAPAPTKGHGKGHHHKHSGGCCDHDDDEDDEDDPESARMVLEAAAEIAPATIRCFGPNASPEITGFVVRIIDRLAKLAASKHSGPGEKSLGFGAMADLLDALESAAGAYANKLYNCLTRGLADDDDEVRQNAVYALGSLCQYGAMVLGASRLDEVSAIMERFLVPGQKGEPVESVRDNALSTMCRALRQHPHPANRREQILALTSKYILPRLPLQGDKRENKTVIEFLNWMLSVYQPDSTVTQPWLSSAHRVLQMLEADKEAFITAMEEMDDEGCNENAVALSHLASTLAAHGTAEAPSWQEIVTIIAHKFPAAAQNGHSNGHHQNGTVHMA